jgi:large subunit ribosomal protein L7A
VLDELKNGRKTVGIKQSLKAVEAGTARLLFIAKDADEKVVGNLKVLAQNSSIEIVYVDTMKQLGKACGIEVGASAACLLK